MLSCPRCAVPLQIQTITTDTEAWQIEIDVCADSCGGLYLDQADFEVDPQAKLLLDQELLSLNRPRRKTIDTSAPVDCPKCRVAMHRYNWNNEGIMLDTCPTCHGRWLDGGEARRIQEEWGKEPIGPNAEAELLRKVASIKNQSDKAWQEETFWDWCVKRLMLTSVRKDKE